jgi:hypothetical protein
VDSVSAGFAKSKKYILPLAVLHPWVAGSIFAVYLANGRFNVAHYAETEYAPADLSIEKKEKLNSAPERDIARAEHNLSSYNSNK